MRYFAYLTVFLSFFLLNCGSVGIAKRSLINDAGVREALKFDHSPEEIRAICEHAQTTINKEIDTIAAVKPSEAKFETLVRLERKLAEFSTALNPVTFLKYTSPNEPVRTAADECEEAVSKLYVDIFAREDLYKVLKGVKANSGTLEEVDNKLVEEYLVEFERNGLELEPEKRKLFIEKKKALVELTTEFDKNLLEWKDHMLLTKDELAGMPDDYIAGLEKEGEKYKVTLAYPHYFPFMNNAKNAKLRKQLQHKFMNRGGDRNTELLEQAVTLRHELAKLLGKESHAEFVLERRMAKKPQAVFDLLNDLKSKLRSVGQGNLEELLALKKKEDPSATEIKFWDWRYYDNQLKKTKYKVDHQKIKEYFPLEVVNKGMFEIYQTLLGVTFVKDDSVARWHDSVLAYQVIDNTSGKQVALFYMDLFPREGKYGHAAAFTLLQGYVQTNGDYQMPVSSIVANFNAPVGEQPSLLTHGQVETHFHEFGHIMHQVLTKAKYATFSGTSVKRDFVEAPSQMLENWAWNKESLRKLSGHYKNTSEPLPDNLIESLVNAKLANVGIKYLRQIFFGLLDMNYHTSRTVNSTRVYQKLSKEIMMIEIPEGTQPQASFGHLMGGYDAGYYGYIWSEVFAQDMFTRFEREGLLSKKAGKDYRTYILEAGGTKDPMELITSFLGRAPNNEAFLKSLGLGTASKPRGLSKTK